MRYIDEATNYTLWTEYVDPNGEYSEEEFDALTVEEKLRIITECFGPEPTEGENATQED